MSISTDHNPVGPYASNQPIEISLAELEESSDQFWPFNYKDLPSAYDPDNPQSLVDLEVLSVVDATVAGSRLSAVLGIDYYAEYGYGMAEMALGMPRPSSFGDLDPLFEYGSVSVFGDPDTGPVTVEVTATEGEVFSGDTKVVGLTRQIRG